jgi:hypothetical protein
MRGNRLAAALIALGLAVAGCAGTTSAAPEKAASPAKVEAVPGKDVKSVTLTEQADKRLGVETVAVAAAASGTSVPYSAVVYSADGNAWVYTVSKPRTYLREKVTVANVGGPNGTDAFLSAGPAVGTTVVKTGVPELYGAELGVGK